MTLTDEEGFLVTCVQRAKGTAVYRLSLENAVLATAIFCDVKVEDVWAAWEKFNLPEPDTDVEGEV